MFFRLPEPDGAKAPENAEGDDGHGEGVVLFVLVGAVLDLTHLGEAVFFLFEEKEFVFLSVDVF